MLEINKIHHGDCLELMKEIPDNYFDLCLTDPPYGIKRDYQRKTICKNSKHNRKFFEKKNWDNNIPPKIIFDEIFRISKKQIIWGGNYFVEYLKPSKGRIIWDKGQRGLTMSDCEMAYSNFDKPTRIYTINRCELIKDFTLHPTQKPLKLFEMILRDYFNEKDLILDCFSGSGTTAIACYNTRRNFICIEKDKDYYEKSVERLKIAQSQLKLF